MEKEGKTSSEEGLGVSPAFHSCPCVDALETGEVAPMALAMAALPGPRGRLERSAAARPATGLRAGARHPLCRVQGAAELPPGLFKSAMLIQGRLNCEETSLEMKIPSHPQKLTAALTATASGCAPGPALAQRCGPRADGSRRHRAPHHCPAAGAGAEARALRPLGGANSPPFRPPSVPRSWLSPWRPSAASAALRRLCNVEPGSARGSAGRLGGGSAARVLTRGSGPPSIPESTRGSSHEQLQRTGIAEPCPYGASWTWGTL